MASEAQRSGALGGLGAMAPGVAAAAVCGAGALGQGPSVALTVAGLLALPLGLCSWLASSARGDLPASGRGLLAAGSAAALAPPALAIFGALLKANTHHKALAGVTFAVVGLGVIAGAAALGARLSVWASELSPEARKASSLVAAGVAALASLLLLARAGLLSPSSLDALALLASLALGWAIKPSGGWGKASAAAGVGLAVALSAGALSQASSPEVARQVAQRGQIAGALVLELHPEARPAQPAGESGEGHGEG